MLTCNYVRCAGCKGTGYAGPLGDTCASCEGNGEVEVPPACNQCGCELRGRREIDFGLCMDCE